MDGHPRVVKIKLASGWGEIEQQKGQIQPSFNKSQKCLMDSDMLCIKWDIQSLLAKYFWDPNSRRQCSSSLWSRCCVYLIVAFSHEGYMDIMQHAVNKTHSWIWCDGTHLRHSTGGREAGRTPANLRPVWSTSWVPGHQGLHSDALSQIKRKQIAPLFACHR